MARHIESKTGLKTLYKRVNDWVRDMQNQQRHDELNLEEIHYWLLCIEGCINEDLAMDEVDYENAPEWFRPLWRGLK